MRERKLVSTGLVQFLKTKIPQDFQSFFPFHIIFSYPRGALMTIINGLFYLNEVYNGYNEH